jgi:hypothetical protein
MPDVTSARQDAGAPSPRQTATRTPFRRLEALARSPWGLILVAAWSFGEAIVVPIVPDVVLGLLVLVVPRRVVPLFVAAVAGSLAGTAVLWWLAQVDPAAMRSVLLGLPEVGPATMADVSRAVEAGDPRALASLGFGAPLKAYSYLWALGPATPVVLAIGVVLNRLTRVGPFVLVCTAVGLLAPRWVRRHDRLVLAAYSGLWVAIYASYWR